MEDKITYTEEYKGCKIITHINTNNFGEQVFVSINGHVVDESWRINDDIFFPADEKVSYVAEKMTEKAREIVDSVIESWLRIVSAAEEEK